MRKRALQIRPSVWTAVIAALACLFGAAAQAQQPICSAWLIESSRFMNVPFGSFMPDRAFVPGSTKPESNIPSVDLPVNVGVIKCGSELILYDTGWKQQDYLKMTGSDHWAPLPDQLKALGFNAAAEMLKFTEDGDPQRLGDAHLMDVRASEDMLRVGEVLWPGQYKPH